MDSLWQDIRFAARVLAKNPTFTVTAVLVLALGIGANAATFTLTNTLLLRPPVAENPEELVGLYSRDTELPDSYRSFSYPNYVDVRDNSSALVDVLVHDLSIVGIAEGDSTRRSFVEFVSSNYFDVFGVAPYRGRFFTGEEEVPEAGIPVAVVSYGYWRSQGEDPGLVGKTIEVNGIQLEIIGIAPENFTGRTAMMSPPVYLPLGLHGRLMSDSFIDGLRSLADRDNNRLLAVARMQPGATVDETNEQLAGLSASLQELYPEVNENQQLMVSPLSRVSVSSSPDNDQGQMAAAFATLMGMTGVVLLLACINLANMLLARGEVRRKEFAVRAAMGSGRGRIVRQLLTEGLMLSALGGIGGLVAASWINGVFAASMNELLSLNGLEFDVLLHSAPDIRVLVATAAFCTIGTLLFALGPALQQSRPDVMEELKQQGTDSVHRAGRGLFTRRNLLIGSQMALSLVLLVAAGLFIRASFKAAGVDPGFDVDRGLLVEVDPGIVGYDEPRSRDLYRQIHERLGSMPGIENVAVAATVPFGSVSSGRSVRRAGEMPEPGELEVATIGSTYNVVGADYFDALGIELTRGRAFTRAETESAGDNQVVIIDEVLAADLWPEADPIGRRVAFGSVPEDGDIEYEVVGVVSTVIDDLFPAEPRPHVYEPFGQNFQTAMNVHLRTASTDPAAIDELLPAVRQEIRSIDAQLPVVVLRSLRDHLHESFSLWMMRVAATIFTTLGGLALFLAVIGVYGVKAYVVAQRTREIGIRKALGSTAGNALALILREGMAVTLGGLIIGLVLSIGVGRLLSSMLYQVSPLDPITFVLAPLVLAAAAFLATWIPARRAAKVPPVVALREG